MNFQPLQRFSFTLFLFFFILSFTVSAKTDGSKIPPLNGTTFVSFADSTVKKQPAKSEDKKSAKPGDKDPKGKKPDIKEVPKSKPQVKPAAVKTRIKTKTPVKKPVIKRPVIKRPAIKRPVGAIKRKLGL